MPIILGVDPGSRSTGYGVISQKESQLAYVDCGCIQSVDSSFPKRLEKIFTHLCKVVQTYHPDEVAVEQIFFHVNPSAALKLGQARGVALLAMGLSELLVSEYSARQVKQAVVGYGAATKQQVQQMVRVLLDLTDIPQADAADALAIAICHAQVRQCSVLYRGFRRGRMR